MELIEHPPILRVPHIPDQVLYMWIVMAVLVVVSIVATRRLQLVPHGTQNMMEVILEQFVKELVVYARRSDGRIASVVVGIGDDAEAALAMLGLPGGPVRPPLADATPAEAERLRTDLVAGGVKLR